jgi:cytochrome c biogenesis protein CcdA
VIADLLAQIGAGSPLAPALGLLAGVLLGLSPVALPAVPVVMSALSPGQADDVGQRSTTLRRAAPSVIAFVIGMDGVLALAGYLFVQVTVLLARGAIVLNLVAAVLLAALGLRLLLRRASLCDQARRLPPRPSEALGAGLLFAVSGCPGCAPIAIGVGTSAALVGGPFLALLTIAAFVAGRAAVLLASAALGARLLPAGTASVPWRRLDVVVGWLFLAASAYYAYRLLSGGVSTRLPGEPGSGLLP